MKMRKDFGRSITSQKKSPQRQRRRQHEQYRPATAPDWIHESQGTRRGTHEDPE